MSEHLQSLTVSNYRCLADVHLTPRSVNVFFGPNGAGKSTLLDVVGFVRDCLTDGVDRAASRRGQGTGILWSGAKSGAPLSIAISTSEVEYTLAFQRSAGGVGPYAGESLVAKRGGHTLIKRSVGTEKAAFLRHGAKRARNVELREPEKLSFESFLAFDPQCQEAVELAGMLRRVQYFPARSLQLDALRTRGSESTHHVRLLEDCGNLWSVLRNLADKKEVDDRFDTIMGLMRKAFPTFDKIVLELITPSVVYAEFYDALLGSAALQASGISDGHLQMLSLLTALFSEGRERGATILFDEPDLSLHPYAIAVFAEAVQMAAEKWERQIFIATHSPVLVSQFATEDLFAVSRTDGGRTALARVSEMHDIADLLERYATGSLYMAELLAPQSNLADEEENP